MNPTPVRLSEKFQGWSSLVGFRLWGLTELDTTETTQQQQQQVLGYRQLLTSFLYIMKNFTLPTVSKYFSFHCNFKITKKKVFKKLRNIK